MIDENWLKIRIRRREYIYPRHSDRECQNDKLLIDEVEQALLQGCILERYPDTGRGESCLVAGFTHAGKPIHVVCGKRQDKIVIITVYIPKPPKFRTIYIRGE